MATDKTELVEFMQNPVVSKEQKLCKSVGTGVCVCMACFTCYVPSFVAALTDILNTRKASDLTINLFGQFERERGSMLTCNIHVCHTP